MDKYSVSGTSELSIAPFSLPVATAAEPVTGNGREPGILRTPAFAPSLAPGNFDPFAVDERIGHLLPGFMEILPDRSPGNSHDCTCLLLHQPVQVDEFQEFKLFGEDYDWFLFVSGIALRCITAEGAAGIHPALDPWPAPPSHPIRYLSFLHRSPTRAHGIVRPRG